MTAAITGAPLDSQWRRQMDPPPDLNLSLNLIPKLFIDQIRDSIHNEKRRPSGAVFTAL